MVFHSLLTKLVENVFQKSFNRFKLSEFYYLLGANQTLTFSEKNADRVFEAIISQIEIA